MPIQVGERVVEAVVDTAAELTLISDLVYHSLRKKHTKIKDVTLLTAGRKLSVKGLLPDRSNLRLVHGGMRRRFMWRP